MSATDQIPAIDSELAKLDKQIEKHIGKKFKLMELYKRVGKMLDYRDRRIRELGAERSRVANFTLDLE